jgi:formylglycine-generating enzyme required for sulfatase activity
MRKMKTITTLSILGILASSLFFISGTFPVDKGEYVNFEKNKFVCKHEVTNKEYRDFLNDLKKSDQSDKYKIALYDSTQWKVKFPNAFNEPILNYYHSNPAYDNYPVTNISKHAAELYCVWLTVKYNSESKIQVVFRLPSEKEWSKFSSPLTGNNLPWYGSFDYEPSNTNEYLANVKFMDMSTGGLDFQLDGAFYTSEVKKFKPNKLGLYDIIGNVSELTNEGKKKGGSWFNLIDECTVDKEQNYDLPDPRVGFRVIYEIQEK